MTNDKKPGARSRLRPALAALAAAATVAAPGGALASRPKSDLVDFLLSIDGRTATTTSQTDLFRDGLTP